MEFTEIVGMLALAITNGYDNPLRRSSYSIKG